MGRVLLGLLCGAVFLGALVYVTLRETSVECQVCVEFGGHSACRTVSAPDRDQAVMQAVSTACAVLSSGVTDGIRCSQAPQRTVSCSGD